MAIADSTARSTRVAIYARVSTADQSTDLPPRAVPTAMLVFSAT